MSQRHGTCPQGLLLGSAMVLCLFRPGFVLPGSETTSHVHWITARLQHPTSWQGSWPCLPLGTDLHPLLLLWPAGGLNS